jgi:hypothetical protein
MLQVSNIRRAELQLFAAILSSGVCKTTFGIALFFETSWLALLFLAALAVIAASIAALVLRRNPKQPRLEQLLNFATSFSSFIYGSLMLILVLTNWRGALTFCLLLLASSPHLQSRLRSARLRP